MGRGHDLWKALMFGWFGGGVIANEANTGGTVLPKHYAAAPLVGYRKWLISNTPTGLALRSLHIEYFWEGRDITARCLHYNQQIKSEHTAPDPDDSCGVYAMLPDQDPLIEWLSSVRGRVSASGSIEMWGRIIRCERGFKAQYVRIEDPIVLEATCGESSESCTAPPSWVELPGHTNPVIWAYCENHRSDIPDRTRVELGPWMREACRQLTEKYGVQVLSWVP